MDVSIIIPSYNRLWSLPKCVESCLKTNLRVEVIVINDGSSDGTAEWLATQPQLVCINQPNQGKDWAVNAGFAMAKGKYIRFLDSDDWVLPYSTDELFTVAERNNSDVVCAGYQLYNEDEVLLKDTPWTVCDDFIAQQLGECDSSHYSAYLFKKEFIKNIPHRPEYRAVDDRKFIIEVAMSNPAIGYTNTLTLAHRAHQQERLQAVTGLHEAANHLAQYHIYKTALAALEKSNTLTQRRKNAACNILWPLAHWIAKNDIKLGQHIYQWVYQLNTDFTPPGNKNIVRLYRTFGFINTERLLRLRRLLKKY